MKFNKNINKEILFSVVVPVYNVKPFLSRCIDSILGQTYKNFELILIDDGSTDGSSDLCDSYLKKDSRVHVVHKNNGGLVSARNTGLHLALGKYIIYIDSDDWVNNDLLYYCNNVISTYPSVDLIIYNFSIVKEDSLETHKFETCDGLYEKNQLHDIQNNILNTFYMDINSCRSAYRKDLLLKHYCKNDKIVRGEDLAYFIEYFLSCKSVYFLNRVFYNYNCFNMQSITKSHKFGCKEIALLGNYIFANAFETNVLAKKGISQYFMYYINLEIDKYIRISNLKNINKIYKIFFEDTSLDRLAKNMLKSNNWGFYNYRLLSAISKKNIIKLYFDKMLFRAFHK